MLLTGCGESDRFAPGEWQVDAWMDSDLGSVKGAPGTHMTDTVKLSERDAAYPPASVFFTNFYHGVQKGDVRFEDGTVEGSFEQPGVDDIAGHNVPISGTYARDKFQVTFTLSAFGMKVRQVVEGRLVAPPGGER